MNKNGAVASIVIFFILGLMVGVSKPADLAKLPAVGAFFKALQLQKSEPAMLGRIESIEKNMAELSDKLIKRDKEIKRLGYGDGVKVSNDSSKTPLYCPKPADVLENFSNAAAWQAGGQMWQIQYLGKTTPKSVGFKGANFSVSSRYMSCRYSYKEPEKENTMRSIYVKLQPKATDEFIAYGNYWRVQKHYASCQAGREACAFLLEK